MIQANTYPFSQPVIWYALFHPEKSWWDRKYSHVSLAGYAPDTWIHLDLHRTGVTVAAIYEFDEKQEFLDYITSHYHVVKMGATETPGYSFGFPITCVSVVKHVLGVRSSALRPSGLFKSLVRNHGGEWINAPEGNQTASASRNT